MFQVGTSPASGSYREILTRLVACATSQHASAVAVAAGGTGYTVGDVVTITPTAGVYEPVVVEVLTVGGGGAITSVFPVGQGAFANRVATVAVAAGGSGYPVSTTIVLELQGGTSTARAKVLATTSAGGVVTAVSLFETGGAYSVAPSSPAATAILGPSTATTGSGCTVTLTMTGAPATVGLASTGGTGTGATFTLTLTASGWSALLDRNGYSFNAINDEKEVILQGTAGTGTDPIVGFRTYTATVGAFTRYGWCIVGMDSFNAGLAYASQPNIGPNPDPGSNAGDCLLLFDNAQAYWFSVKPRRIVAVVRAVGASITAYNSLYVGLLNPFATAIETPYPLYVSATTTSHTRPPDVGGNFATGLTELLHDTLTNGPSHFRRQSDGSWQTVQNSGNNAALGTNIMHPLGGSNEITGSPAEDDISDPGRFVWSMLTGGGISAANGGAASQILMPALGTDEVLRVPAVVLTPAVNGSTGEATSECLIRGELDGVFWIPGTKADGNPVASEDLLTTGAERYLVFANSHRTFSYSFFALRVS